MCVQIHLASWSNAIAISLLPNASHASALNQTISILQFIHVTSGNLSYFYCGGIAAELQAKLHFYYS